MEGNSKIQYDVAFSFAGEDRAYVERVVDVLKQHQIRVFYDKDAELYLWGKDLGDTLDEVYRLQSRYVVMFISEHYARKMWTNHERKSALARAIQEKQEYVLPARFDDTALTGLRPTVSYIDLRKEAPESFAAKILQKVGQDVALQSSKDSTSTQALPSPSRQVREIIGYAILGISDESLLPFFRLFGDQPTAKQPGETEYEDIYFDDFDEMNQVFNVINGIVAKAKELEKRGEDRQQSFERVWMEEVISRASQYAFPQQKQSRTAEANKIPGLKYLIWGVHREYAPMIKALRTQQFLYGPAPQSRDAQEVYFKNVAIVPEIPAVVQKAVHDANGDNQLFMQLLLKAVMRLRTFGADENSTAG